jgi:hypothetical protein
MKIDRETYKGYLDLLLRKIKGAFGDDFLLSFALFGSVARGEARPDSDIDLLIVHKEVDFNPMRRFVDLVLELQRSEEYERLKRIGLHPDPYPIFMTKKELWEHPLILLDVLDHGIIIYDTGVLKRRLDALKKRLEELGSKKILLEDGSWYWDLKPDWKPGEVIKL